MLDRGAARCARREGGHVAANFMKSLIFFFITHRYSFVDRALSSKRAQVNVTQKNNNPSRDGHYIDAAFTPGNAANLTRDMNFNGTISGNVHAQPLYIEGGPNGPMVIVVTASNNVYALHADTGTPDLVAHRHWPGGNFRSSVRK